MNAIPNDILMLLQTREHNSRPREVYKEEKIKIHKDSSREVREDDDWVEVSARPAFGPGAVAPQPTAVDFVSDPKGESGNVISPRELSSRYSGISVQHVRTAKGVKLAITLQKPAWVPEGACQMATAELKRSDRLREIKSRAEDSQHFADYLANAKHDIQESRNRTVCMGRLHQRSRRSQWLYDTLAIAFFEGDRMSKVMLYLEGEEHIIEMDEELSDSQQKYYWAAGRYGNLHSATRVPKLDDLPLVKFGE